MASSDSDELLILDSDDDAIAARRLESGQLASSRKRRSHQPEIGDIEVAREESDEAYRDLRRIGRGQQQLPREHISRRGCQLAAERDVQRGQAALGRSTDAA